MRYLLTQAYTIIAHKWRCKHGEIDLIALDDAELVFIEVRTRHGQSLPEESVNFRKQRKLIELAYSYVSQNISPPDIAWRIDVIAITMDKQGNVIRLNHIRDAVEETS